MISFIIPVWKKPPEQFNRTVKSLLNMSVKDIEIISVFDGEDPILQPHAEKWAKNKRFRYKVIDHGGACKARNAGIEEAKGDYIAAWDADCYAEPEMAQVWLDNFRRHPEVDFVYSGYKWANHPEWTGFDSEAFDPWTLTKYNYIASMFPIKREKVLKWDEDLSGLQDWDYWRRVVEAGGKGKFIPGYGFWTEFPDDKGKSISSQTEKKEERIRAVRAKHGDKKSDILVSGQTFKRDALIVAKTLNADYFYNPAYWMIDPYKLVISVGLHPWDLEDASGLMRSLPKGTKKAIYWKGYDVDNFAVSPYVQVRSLMNSINNEIDHNFAVDERTLGVMEDLEIKKSELLIFPREQGTPADKLPEQFKVLGWADEAHIQHLKTVAQAMPDVHFDFVEPNKEFNLLDYSVILQFTNAPKLEGGTRNALMMGRHVISNVQAPYSGYVSLEDASKFVASVTEQIEELRNKSEINKEAQDYYLQETDPEKFKARIAGVLQ